MSRGSALARVIGLTRSFSPLGQGERDSDAGKASDATADAVVAGAVAETDPADATATIDATPESPANEDGEAPALAQVTVVAETGTIDVAAAEPVQEAVATATIDAIEADIASLLSSLDIVSDARPAARVTDADDDGDEALAAGGDSEEATLALLSELDRMWRADPAVGNSYMR